MKIARSLAIAASVATLAGCGEKPTTYESIKVPKGSTDMGLTEVNEGIRTYDAHSFAVKSKQVGQVSCGAINTGDEGDYNGKKVTPAGDDTSQVDCIFYDETYTMGELDKMEKLPVDTVDQR